VVFEQFEVPEEINFGGWQRIAVHRLAGGGRIIDALGPDEPEICFAGVFSGPNSVLRARSVDVLRRTGEPIPLIWDSFYYTVLVRQFGATYTSATWIPYSVSCAVVRDEAAGLIEAAVDLTATVLGDVMNAAGSATLAGFDISGLLDVFGSEPRAMSGVDDRAQLLNARGSLGARMLAAESDLAFAGGATVGTPEAAISGLSSASRSVQQISALASAKAYLGRADFSLVALEG
jgi:hypothetical protein